MLFCKCVCVYTFSNFWGGVLEYHFGILYIVICFKMYTFTNLGTFGLLVWDTWGTIWYITCSTLILEVIILKLCTSTVALISFTEIVPIILSECLFYLVHFKDDKTNKPCVFLFLSKPDLLCYSPTFNSHLQTSEFLLWNGTNNMHILGSVPELQAVRFGYVFRQKLQKVGG